MFDGLAGRGVARGARVLLTPIAIEDDLAAQRGHKDPAIEAVHRPSAASPAAIVQLSKAGQLAMANQRGSPSESQPATPPMLRDDEARAPPELHRIGTGVRTGVETMDDANDESPAFEPILLGSATSVGDALARYELLMSDPGAALGADSPIRILPR